LPKKETTPGKQKYTKISLAGGARKVEKWTETVHRKVTKSKLLQPFDLKVIKLDGPILNFEENQMFTSVFTNLEIQLNEEYQDLSRIKRKVRQNISQKTRKGQISFFIIY